MIYQLPLQYQIYNKLSKYSGDQVRAGQRGLPGADPGKQSPRGSSPRTSHSREPEGIGGGEEKAALARVAALDALMGAALDALMGAAKEGEVEL